MPWQRLCVSMDKGDTPLPTPSTDNKEWIRQLIILFEEINDDFIELKRLYVSTLC